MPYLGTIILMLVFHMVGTPISDLISSEKTDISHEITLDETANITLDSYASSTSYYYFQEKTENTRIAIEDCTSCAVLKCPHDYYHSRASRANSNKAPPYFI